MEKYGRARQATVDNVIWRMRVACWITKGTDTHSEYVMLIAFLRQQMLRERVPANIPRYVPAHTVVSLIYILWGYE